MDKPQVGIASVWYEGNTCNMHLDRLAVEVKQGVVAAGLVGMRFNTIGVSDGISMGTEGMSYSLAVAGSDRRFDRNDHERPVVRRLRRAAGLRQEHAWLPDRDGSTESAVADGLRRHDSSRQLGNASWISFPRFSVLVSMLLERSTTKRGRRSCGIPVPGRAHAAECTPPTRWPARSKRLGMSLPYSCFHPGGGSCEN